MDSDIPIQRALISVSDKTGIAEFVKSLVKMHVEIISTGGTAEVLKGAGIEVTTVESLTGFPEILSGRIKTLHPIIHGGLLAARDDPSHVLAMSRHHIQPIDLVCIDLYPFEKTIQLDGVSSRDIIEQIDIGGPAMIRSAAKNHRFVTVITDPDQYSLVLEDMKANNGATTLELRIDLSLDAFARTADYDTTISQWMEGETSSIPMRLRIGGQLEQTLRYGENPHQSAAVYRNFRHNGPNVVTASVVAGKPLSYNNLIDAAAALELVQDLHAATNFPCAVILKHTNPCGAAATETLEEAFSRAWQCDPLAAFGGIVALSGIVDVELAHTISHGDKFLEVIVAPSFTQDGAAALSDRWKNIRLLEVGSDLRPVTWQQIRSIEGGILVQEASPITANTTEWEHVAGPKATESQLSDAVIAWITCAHLKSNAISIVDSGALIGGGMGQVDRVSAARLAVQRAGGALEKSQSPVAGSDAFFPFSDGPEILIDAGIRCIVQPGGSKRDLETIEVCESRNVTLLHTGMRRFKH
jgi:phosphoribosylaminoimidazolecarboxamide formyltransferase/IMP cyclohydrolase